MNGSGVFFGIVQLVEVLGMEDMEDAALYHALLGS